MKRWMSIILGTLIVVMCMINMTIPAFAEETPGVSIPVTVSLSGQLPKPAENYTIKLRADDPSYPMPAGTVNGVYEMKITGAATQNFPTITYDRVGIYTYTVWQEAGSNKKCTYDETMYYLTVYITNAEDGSGLESTVVLHLKPGLEGEKVPDIVFANKYAWDPKSPRTSDDATPVLYAVMIAGGLGVITALLLTRKPKESEE